MPKPDKKKSDWNKINAEIARKKAIKDSLANPLSKEKAIAADKARFRSGL